MPLVDGATFAGYTIIRLLGAGGMGEVYLARHPRLQRQDALKVLADTCTEDHEYRQRFDREADVVAGLWHPHIVGVHDRGEFDGKLWISMDYVDGIDGAELLRRNPEGLPLAQVVPIITAVAEALDYAHARHLLHRDVKPANILIADPGTPDERILLADFGIARRDDEVSNLTATDMTVGTVSYAAPEQLMGSELDGRADQYALAATAFHLLTGAPPFQHSNPAVVISQHLTAAPPRLARRRPELADLDPALTKALSKNPADRFARSIDFARALAHPLAQPLGGAAPAPTPDLDATRRSPAARPDHPHRAAPRHSRPAWLRTAVLLPLALTVLLVAAVAFAMGEFEGDREVTTLQTRAGTTPTAGRTAPPRVMAPPAPATDVVTETETEIEDAMPGQVSTGVVIGASCTTPDATASTPTGATAHCANLQYTDRYLWSTIPGVVPNPLVPSPPASPPPYETESPVRICMNQTGHSRLRCESEILRGNAR
jgi:serine/threonine protein kinase, bacterial